MGMPLAVARSVIATLVREGARTHPNEACGLLLGTPNRIDTAVPTRNVHPTARTHFEIDPAALIAAHKAARAGGPELVGYYHSHPTGSAQPSPTDQANASGDGKVWAIVAGGEATFWRDAPGEFEPLPTRVVAG